MLLSLSKMISLIEIIYGKTLLINNYDIKS